MISAMTCRNHGMALNYFDRAYAYVVQDLQDRRLRVSFTASRLLRMLLAGKQSVDAHLKQKEPRQPRRSEG